MGRGEKWASADVNGKERRADGTQSGINGANRNVSTCTHTRELVNSAMRALTRYVFAHTDGDSLHLHLRSVRLSRRPPASP